MIHFKLAHHSIRHTEVVEVWMGDRMVATIYPADNSQDSIRIASRHLYEHHLETLPGETVTMYRFQFQPKP